MGGKEKEARGGEGAHKEVRQKTTQWVLLESKLPPCLAESSFLTDTQ